MHWWILCTHISRLLDVVWSMLLLLQRLFSHLMWLLLIQRKQSLLVDEGWCQLLISCDHLIWCQLLISCKHLIWCRNQVFVFTNMLHRSQAYMRTCHEHLYWISNSALFFLPSSHWRSRAKVWQYTDYFFLMTYICRHCALVYADQSFLYLLFHSLFLLWLLLPSSWDVNPKEGKWGHLIWVFWLSEIWPMRPCCCSSACVDSQYCHSIYPTKHLRNNMQYRQGSNLKI